MDTPKPRMSREEAERVLEAAKRAIGVARTGIPLEAAIADTAMQSGIEAKEIARVIEIALDALLAARKGATNSKGKTC